MGYAWVVSAVITGIIVAIVLIVDALIVFVAVPRVVASAWAPIAKYAPVEPAPDAVRRNFQSFKLGLLNMGWSVHVAVDEEHLHLFPALVMRLWGMNAASVPWGEIRDRGPALFRQRKVRIGTAEVVGPAWCLGLAAGERAGG